MIISLIIITCLCGINAYTSFALKWKWWGTLWIVLYLLIVFCELVANGVIKL